MDIGADGPALDRSTSWMSPLASDREELPERPESSSLVERAVAGDTAAFEELVVQNEHRVLTLAWRLLGSPHEAQDAVQEVFLRAFKYLHRFDRAKPVGPWLAQITVNVCRDLGRRRRPMSTLAVEDADRLPDDRGRSPHDEVALAQRRRMLWSALDELPTKQRAAIVLRDLEGYSTEETSRILKSSPATIRSQISSARLRIRRTIRRMKGSDL